VPVTATVHVVWHPDRERWTVEGGHGTAAVLGVVSTHGSKAAAVRAAHRVARDHDAEVEIVGDPDGVGDPGSGREPSSEGR